MSYTSSCYAVLQLSSKPTNNRDNCRHVRNHPKTLTRSRQPKPQVSACSHKKLIGGESPRHTLYTDNLPGHRNSYRLLNSYSHGLQAHTTQRSIQQKKSNPLRHDFRTSPGLTWPLPPPPPPQQIPPTSKNIPGTKYFISHSLSSCPPGEKSTTSIKTYQVLHTRAEVIPHRSLTPTRRTQQTKACVPQL